MASRKTHMTAGEVYEYSKMDEAELAAVIMKLGVSKSAELFKQFLRSFHITANAANAGWKFCDASSATTPEPARINAAWEELRRTLHLYAPEALPVFQADLEYGCRLLEEMYDYLTAWNTPEMSTAVVMEKLFERICEMRQRLAQL